jgi:uncharacterized membrane protein YagU involved in acid resistance
MAETHEHERETKTTIESQTWITGGISGLVAGIVMGIMLQMMMTPVITTAIPALYGANGLVAGWIAHLVHSIVFGLIFAAIVVSIPSLRGYADRLTTSAGLGIVYGVLVWIVAAGIVMPIWLGAVGFPMVPPLPNFNPMSLVGHVVYGVILGGLFPLLRNR